MWAKAVGPWQFIASTGKLYNLRRDWWADERRDFIKSTHAAARFLKNLYDQFGSWELALAAYNGGPGRVEGALRKQQTNDFWDLDLRKQTEDYVPFYMAATIIAKSPERYGFRIDYEPGVSHLCHALHLRDEAGFVHTPSTTTMFVRAYLWRRERAGA